MTLTATVRVAAIAARCQTVVVAPPMTRACLTGGIGSDGRCTE
jgi:hypothetical protein